MIVSYKILWKLLIDREMSKTALRQTAGITSSSMAKLSKGENVTTTVLVKICEALHCKLDDIAEVIEEDGLM